MEEEEDPVEDLEDEQDNIIAKDSKTQQMSHLMDQELEAAAFEQADTGLKGMDSQITGEVQQDEQI